jgi:hypothetical protein
MMQEPVLQNPVDPGTIRALESAWAARMPGWHGEAVLEKADCTHGDPNQRHSVGSTG